MESETPKPSPSRKEPVSVDPELSEPGWASQRINPLAVPVAHKDTEGGAAAEL